MRGISRLCLVETARGILPPDEPEVLRALGGLLYRFEHHARRDLMHALMARSGAPTRRAAESLAREALDVDMQRRLEELVLPRVPPASLDRYCDLEGAADLGDDLLVAGRAPHPMLALVALVRAVPGLAALRPGPEAVEGTAMRFLAARFAAERATIPARWVDSIPLEACFLVEGAPWPADRPARAVLVHRARDKRWRVRVTGRTDVSRALAEHAARWPGQVIVSG
ncbi:MAG: hypothetical protein FJ090_05970 [Deltaproteobacteria bacterium]|nr:hypothetical protein [Deltaproteobacteria bacterium]